MPCVARPISPEAEPDLQSESCGPESSCATITLSVCEESIDRWWSKLDLDKKAEIFAEHFDCCG